MSTPSQSTPPSGPVAPKSRAAAADRVATIIGVVKWVIIGLTILAGVITFIAGVAKGDAAGIGIAFGSVVGALIYAAITWVLFGWFEHTLGLLAELARK